MQCPKCPGEMRYFKDYERDVDGYRCPLCQFEKLLVAIDLGLAEAAESSSVRDSRQ